MAMPAPQMAVLLATLNVPEPYTTSVGAAISVLEAGSCGGCVSAGQRLGCELLDDEDEDDELLEDDEDEDEEEEEEDEDELEEELDDEELDEELDELDDELDDEDDEEDDEDEGHSGAGCSGLAAKHEQRLP